MSKHWRITSLLILAMTVGLFVSACGGGSGSGSTGSSSTSTPSNLGTPGSYNCIGGSLTASGSTALAPLVQAVAKDYQAKCSSASITVNLGGSGTGLSQVESGTVQIGNSDIFKKSSQPDLVDHQVAIVVFTVIINSKVTGVTNLTTNQLKGIYSGSITNWNQIGGPNLKIVVVSRPTSSGTRATFQQYILGGPESVTGPSSLVTDSTGTVVKNIGQTDGAIGYAASGPAMSAQSSGLVKIVNIDGNAPTATLVQSNTYKFWNIEHMYTKGQPTQLAQALIDYMASSDGQQSASKLSFLLYKEMSSSAIQAHQPQS
jgi:phosphate transport system substrate-binding protein